MSKTMYGISVNGTIVSTVADAAIASTIAAAVDGEVVIITRQAANSFAKSATKVDAVPPRFAGLLAKLKANIKDEIGNESDSVWEFNLRCDGQYNVWHLSIKDLAQGKPVWNVETGEKYNSIVHALHERGLAVATAYPMSKVKCSDPDNNTKSLFTTARSKLAVDLRNSGNV